MTEPETTRTAPTKPGSVGATRARAGAIVWISIVVLIGIGAHRLGQLDPPPPAVRTLTDAHGATVSFLDAAAAPGPRHPRVDARVIASRTPIEIDPRSCEVVFPDGRRRRIPPAANLVLVGADAHVDPMWIERRRPGPLVLALLSATGPPSSWAEWFRNPSLLAALGPHGERVLQFWR